ncbi:flagellar export protein FliJ [Alcaligenes sp. SDU_A2]|uniref:flagellar export protein FliJ n=1 Tax=Alcaligenes sp. SDU_A2 TaxID=3136634 RepID=UPI002C237932|nr:flagellar export protein FliJ [Alcaligenes sp.]HRL25950.1 flagellar export protein FliJ [Alcaligenes sp.]
MKSHSSLNTLVELTQNQVDEAGRQLQELNSQRENAATQLDTLQNYRQDYAQRLLDAGQTGLSMANYHNFRRFIATLDDAISQQNKIILSLEGKIQEGRQHWHAQQQRLNAYETLIDRRLLEQQRHQQRMDQRASDEIAARLFARSQTAY